jgi:anti-sigma factor RsiW
MTTRGHEEQVENVGAYALGALPDLEAQVFERHLMGCTPCQDELQRLNEAANALPRSVTPYAAPPSLKEELMSVVREEASRSQSKPARERRSWWPQMRPAFAMAAAALLAALAVIGFSRDSGDGDTRTVAAEVDERVVPSGSASLVIAAGDDGAALHVEDMPDPGRGKVYEVWVQRGEDVVPVSIFSVDANGDGVAAVPGSLDDVKAVMVTREKAGGATAPTGEPVMSVEI